MPRHASRYLLAAALLVPLAACGKKVDLRPASGHALPPAPVGATKTPTPAELMTATTQARPERKDELIKQSQERPVDEFDLPPPG